MSNSASSSSRRKNTIGLNGHAFDAVLNDLDSSTLDEQTNKDRRHTRMSFRQETVHMKVRQAGGMEPIIKVACRNLSRGGMSILHNSYIHPGSPCAVVLKHVRTGQSVVEGEIVRCQHRQGIVHEIGIKFRKSINLRKFFDVGKNGEIYSFENIDPAELEGCLLHVSDSMLDAKLMQHFLKDSRLRLRQTQNVDEALAHAGESCDLIVLDMQLPEGGGATFLNQLRAGGNLTPVIIVSGDNSSLTRKKLIELGADAYLSKPFEQDILLRSIAEFMLARRNGVNMVADVSLPESQNSEMFDEEFGIELQSIISDLGQELNARNADGCRNACFRLVGVAPWGGKGSLTRDAQNAARTIASEGIEQAVEDVQALIDTCKKMLET